MKKYILLFIISAEFIVNLANAQDMAQSQVPSIVLNKFQSEFTEAKDIEWEKKGEQYQVEFETGWWTDHEAWYTSDGEMVKHVEDISTKDLPEAVRNSVSEQFDGFTIDDAKIITEGAKSTYQLELDSRKQDWEVLIDPTGKVIDQKAD